MNELEQRLRQVPLKPVPADWRGKILAAAKLAQTSNLSSERVRASEQSVLARLHGLLWPHPKAWAGLATAWVAIFALNLSQRDESPGQAETAAPPSPEMRAELQAQQQMFVELLGPPSMSDADRARFKPPQPRTQIVRITMV